MRHMFLQSPGGCIKTVFCCPGFIFAADRKMDQSRSRYTIWDSKQNIQNEQETFGFTKDMVGKQRMNDAFDSALFY